MDNSFKKMILVNPDAIRHATSTDMTSDALRSIGERKVSSLDQEMKDILNSNMPDDEKAKRYSVVVSKYQRLVLPSVKYTNPDEEILADIDDENNSRAAELLNVIKPHLSWNENGEIIVNNQVTAFSNISRLLSDLMSAPSAKKPTGWDEMVDVLNKAHVPSDLILKRNVIAASSNKKTTKKKKVIKQLAGFTGVSGKKTYRKTRAQASRGLVDSQYTPPPERKTLVWDET